MSRAITRISATALVVAIAITIACGPSSSTTDDDSSADASTTTGASSTSTTGTDSSATIGSSMTSADETATTSSSSSSGSSSSGELPSWGDPVSLVTLEDPGVDAPVANLLAVGGYVQASSTIGTWWGRTWVVDRDDGGLTALLDVGGELRATDGRVYAAGLLDGGLGVPRCAEFLLARFAADGSSFEETFTDDGPLWLRAASSDAAFFERRAFDAPPTDELWSITDDSPDAELRGDSTELTLAPATYDLGKLLAFDAELGVVQTIDPASLLVEQVGVLEGEYYVAARNDAAAFFAGPSGIARVETPSYEISTTVPEIRPLQLVADDQGTYWVGNDSDDRSAIVVADPDGSNETMIWTEPVAHISAIATDELALYFVVAVDGSPGGIFRIERPR